MFNMKIYFDFAINSDDFNQLKEDFNTVDYIDIPWNEDREESFEQIVVDSKDLNILEFDDWIQNWLINHELKFKDHKYMLTY